MNHRILVIEDNSEMQDLMRTLLEQEGYSMISATTAGDALTVLRSHPELMLILLDHTLPDMNAQALLDRMRKENLAQEVPILFFSAHHGLQKLGLPEGVVGVIQKPFRVQDFLDTLSTFKHEDEEASSFAAFLNQEQRYCI